MEKIRLYPERTRKEREMFARCGSWVDEVYQLNPFLAVKDTGGSNGEPDVKFKRLLRTERFALDLPDSVQLPVDHRAVLVVERIFLENYENVFIGWTVKMADGSVQNPYKFIGLHETDLDTRRYPEDAIVRVDEVRIKQSAIDGFRSKAAALLSKAQHRACLRNKPKKRELSYDGTPVELKL